MTRLLLAAIIGACGAPTADSDPVETPDPVSLRVATFNVSLFRASDGQLATDLSDPAHPQGAAIATVLQEIRPDIVLLNELDWDADGIGVQRLIENFLAVAQDGREPLAFAHYVAPPVNTGAPSGFDLNNDGTVGGAPGTREYGEDAWGFGEFPGQYGFVVLSRFPVVSTRTFQTFQWSAMDDPQLPDGWFDADEAAAMRLSSKNHADVLLDIDGHALHILASHPTPPGFDGPEDRNGLRNRAEVQFWADYLDGKSDSYHVDDAGQRGGIGNGAFVVVGDLNIDPVDGERTAGIASLLGHSRVNAVVPTSAGGVQQAEAQGGVNDSHQGDPAADTADFSDGEIGNRRVDYALPSTELEVTGSGIFWPTSDEPLFDLVSRQPFGVSDHRLVWVDVTIR